MVYSHSSAFVKCADTRYVRRQIRKCSYRVSAHSSAFVKCGSCHSPNSRHRWVSAHRKPLGRGGFSQVWKAKRLSPTSSHVVALKFLSASLDKESAVSALKPELEIWRLLSLTASSLPSPHLVPVVRMHGLHTSDDGKHACISMQLCSGGSLEQVIATGPLDERRAVSVAHTIATALHKCHSLRVLHLDVKPDNVLFPSVECRDDGKGALLADFGLLLPHGQSTLVSPRGFGTRGYRAREAITHRIHSPASLTGCLPPHDCWDDPDELIPEFEDWPNYDDSLPSWLDGYMGNVYQCSRWFALSPDARDAIHGLLCPNPSLRLTPLQLIHHPWLAAEQAVHEQYKSTLFPATTGAESWPTPVLTSLATPQTMACPAR